MTVQHLVNNFNFFIQLTVDDELPAKEIFNPACKVKMVDKTQPVYKGLYPPGSRFKIKEGGAVVEVAEIYKGSRGGDNYAFKYCNRSNKNDFKMYLTEIIKALGYGRWEIYTGL